MSDVKEFGKMPGPGVVAIGIDQSYTGFAMTIMSITGDEYLTKVYKAPGRGIDRLNNIWVWLMNEIAILNRGQYYIFDVAAESPVRMSPSALISGELWAIVRLGLLCELATSDSPGQYPLQVAPAMLKKYVTGKGTGVQKNQMLLHVYKKWGVEFNDDNAADSYGLARIAAGLGETTYEQEIIRKLQDDKYRDA